MPLAPETPVTPTAPANGKSVKGPAFAIALIVAACCAALLPSEARKYTPYYDQAKVLTVCAGITGPAVRVHPGVPFTKDECDKLEKAYVTGMIYAMSSCLSDAAVKDMKFDEWIAYGHWAYNVGTPAFCHSTVAVHLNAGNHEAACRAMGRWTFITKPGRGLVNCRDPKEKCGGLPKRRDYEVSMCLEAL